MSTVHFIQQENARLKDEIEHLQDENEALRHYINALEELHWATQKIISEENLLKLLDQILYNAMNVLNAQGGSLLIRDDETDELAFVVVHGDIRRELQGYRIGGDVGIAGWVATNRKPVVVNKPRQDRRFSPQVDEAFSFVTQSLLCVPMVTRNKLIGVIQLVNKKKWRRVYRCRYCAFINFGTCGGNGFGRHPPASGSRRRGGDKVDTRHINIWTLIKKPAGVLTGGF